MDQPKDQFTVEGSCDIALDIMNSLDRRGEMLTANVETAGLFGNKDQVRLILIRETPGPDLEITLDRNGHWTAEVTVKI